LETVEGIAAETQIRGEKAHRRQGEHDLVQCPNMPARWAALKGNANLLVKKICARAMGKKITNTPIERSRGCESLEKLKWWNGTQLTE